MLHPLLCIAMSPAEVQAVTGTRSVIYFIEDIEVQKKGECEGSCALYTPGP